MERSMINKGNVSNLLNFGINLFLRCALKVPYLRFVSYRSSHHATSNSIRSASMFALCNGSLIFWFSADEALIIVEGSHQQLAFLVL